MSTMAALIPVPPMSTPIARNSPESVLREFSLKMVCALYRLYAILLGHVGMIEIRARENAVVFALLAAREQETIGE